MNEMHCHLRLRLVGDFQIIDAVQRRRAARAERRAHALTAILIAAVKDGVRSGHDRYLRMQMGNHGEHGGHGEEMRDSVDEVQRGQPN
jgi:hypothetical protein